MAVHLTVTFLPLFSSTAIKPRFGTIEKSRTSGRKVNLEHLDTVSKSNTINMFLFCNTTLPIRDDY